MGSAGGTCGNRCVFGLARFGLRYGNHGLCRWRVFHPIMSGTQFRPRHSDDAAKYEADGEQVAKHLCRASAAADCAPTKQNQKRQFGDWRSRKAKMPAGMPALQELRGASAIEERFLGCASRRFAQK